MVEGPERMAQLQQLPTVLDLQYQKYDLKKNKNLLPEYNSFIISIIQFKLINNVIGN